MSDPFRTVFAIYPGLTQLDFTGPFEILARLPRAEAIVASRDGGAIRSDTGLEIGATRRLADIDACDLICVPGGPGVEAASLDPEFLAELKRLATGARYITSVCNGSLILGAAGLLKGKRAAVRRNARRRTRRARRQCHHRRRRDGGDRFRPDGHGRYRRRTHRKGNPACGGICPGAALRFRNARSGGRGDRRFHRHALGKPQGVLREVPCGGGGVAPPTPASAPPSCN